MSRLILIAFFLLSLLSSRCTTNTEVDLIVYNAQVYTVDSLFSKAEAFAVKNGIFIAIGTSDEILKRYNSREKIDAHGKPIYPGFYDSHVHFFMLADLFQQVDLKGAKSISEIITKLKQYQLQNPDKKWIIGGGWDQNLWTDKQFPTKDSLDKYFPETAIFLSRIDYHVAWVNSKAMRLARLDSVVPVEGGLIVPDSLGYPSGILIDNAKSLISRFIPEVIDLEMLTALRQVQDSLFSVGLTTIVDAGLERNQLDMLRKFYMADSLKIRNYAMILADLENLEKDLQDGPFHSDRLSIKGVKLFADGALGSRGACLRSPYSDDSTNFGLLLHRLADYDRAIELLAKTPFQVSTHAIGDSAVHIIADLYGKYLGENNDRRWRIEHAQVVSEDDFPKFKKYQIIPSIQPTHATSDMYWVTDRLGKERVKNAYAYRKLLNEYGKVALGSDFPVEHFNPLYGFHAAVARVDKFDFPLGGFHPENALSREEALRGMTSWAAYACFQEMKRGSVEKGKDADFVVLDKDIMNVPFQEIRSTKSLRTVIGGQTVFKR